ncbi:hypothetical protein SEA_KIMBERLIUM_93 [Mycobacterium phage Kimberlium]|uniref:Uncharacterized protein n=1 Tax=Mycobacterium phage Kimberlium TaxID=1662284 RepID=A0A0K1LKY1_9CAUD|nr:hypothetical protein SEA_KIMBERLIUM_93 [Mycobacterium phage Kimberlium]AKU43171.1 hypothetical protein SEA_KIMBERLIUM_93 [Mycobacterium phage Kimberlium]
MSGVFPAPHRAFHRLQRTPQMSVYALKQPRPGGGEWIQEHDSLEDALQFQSHSGGILVRREAIPGQPGLWWVEVNTDDLPSDVGSVVQSEPNQEVTDV